MKLRAASNIGWKLSPSRAMLPIMIVSLGCTYAVGGGFAAQPEQPAYASPAAAGEALFKSVQEGNTESIRTILGGPTELASSNDDVQDKVDRDQFVEKYREMHRFGREDDGCLTLYIGAENWPFPIPLVKGNAGWRFDSETGAKEVLFRQIGDNELTAIAICREFRAAEGRYRSGSGNDSDIGTSPLSLAARAATGGPAGPPVLFHGYYFRLIPGKNDGSSQAGTLIAYPAKYRASGVMTIVSCADKTVYEKDLGPGSAAKASQMKSFKKDKSWRASQD